LADKWAADPQHRKSLTLQVLALNYVLAKIDDPEDLLGRDLRADFYRFCLAGFLVSRKRVKSSFLAHR